LPTFDQGSSTNSPLNVNLSILSSGTSISTPWGDFQFYTVPQAARMAAFAIDTKSDLQLSIKLIAERSNLLEADVLVFTILTSYKVPNISQREFSTPVFVKMIKSSVCI
jgi:hypothetical protein